MNAYAWQAGSLRQNAYAKINTYLEVLSRRPDGYHDLCSHMQLISLCDTLDVTVQLCPAQGVSVTLQCDHPQLSCGEDNLIVRAARAFCAAIDPGMGGIAIRFSLQKRIPMQGGLGGGSADAAAALMALNRLCGAPMNTDQLCALGATLGADIPMCIRGNQGPQTARGIGELLSPAPGLAPDITLLIVLPGTAVSTPAAFRLLDEGCTPQQMEQREQALQQRYAAHLQALASGDIPVLALTSFNRFEEAVFALQPQTAQVFALLQSLQPDAVRMSGSGPTLVGYFASSERAAAAQRALQSRGLESVLCHPLA